MVSKNYVFSMRLSLPIMKAFGITIIALLVMTSPQGSTQLYALAAATTSAENDFSPEAFYRETVETWQTRQTRRSRTTSSSSWGVWKDFALTITSRYETIIGKDGTGPGVMPLHAGVMNGADSVASAADFVGAMEEGILTIERIIFSQQESSGNSADDEARDSCLAVLYTEYGRLLLYSSEANSSSPSQKSSHRCYELANDPHTLLIGAPERLKEYDDKKKDAINGGANNDNESLSLLLSSLFGPLCRDNAENALRNAISLDATCHEADLILEQITGLASKDTVHARKPKEFVAELFDSFADTFDEKLTKTLDYRVPKIIGTTVRDLFVDENNKAKKNKNNHVVFRYVLDAGCGTGLAGRELRNAIDNVGNNNNNNNNGERITLVGVDASTKMLEIAEQCTTTQGCGLPISSTTATTDERLNNELRLYDALLDLDLEEMTLENTLMLTNTETDSGFDLIVAADVFVYFGSLERILQVFSSLHNDKNNDSSARGGVLVFTCEVATTEEAPLGYRLLPTGRFAHTKEHAVQAASFVGYSLSSYKQIVPRTEKGAAVDGHLFVFQYTGGKQDEGEL